jgi:hypothetical protein
MFTDEQKDQSGVAQPEPKREPNYDALQIIDYPSQSNKKIKDTHMYKKPYKKQSTKFAFSDFLQYNEQNF